MSYLNTCCRLFTSLVFLCGLSGCSSIDYFSHLAKGQFSLLWDRKEVSELLVSDALSEELKLRLQLSQAIRTFASDVLHLPVGDAYATYTDLGRSYVVWNVYAAPELSFESYTWCYPILGCMAYRGFYNEERATLLAHQLEEEGYDVKVGGVKAYSTMGFFADPLLNTFMFQNEVAFVELLIHELSHRKLYIKDDTKFNENFATAVATLGAEKWYQEQKNPSMFMRYQSQKIHHNLLVVFLLEFKEQLSKLYQDERLSSEQKRELKQGIFLDLQQKYQTFKSQHHFDDRYDQWVLSMNNASLSTLANYQELVPGFIELYHQQDGDWLAFYRAVDSLAKLEKNERHDRLLKSTADQEHLESDY